MADATITLTDDPDIPGKFNLTTTYSGGDIDQESVAHHIAWQLTQAVIDSHPVDGEPEQEAAEESRIIVPNQGVIHGL